MNFTDALDLLLQGKMMQRDAWVEDESYCVILPKAESVLAIAPHSITDWVPYVEDLTAEDWRILVTEEAKDNDDIVTDDGA